MMTFLAFALAGIGFFLLSLFGLVFGLIPIIAGLAMNSSTGAKTIFICQSCGYQSS